MSTPAALIVSTHLRWVAADMRQGAAGRFPVAHDATFDLVPELPPGDLAWWVTTGHGARLVAAGVPLVMDLAGTGWLPALPTALTGRAITEASLEEVAHAGIDSAGFIKPATAKCDQLAGEWVPRVSQAAAQALGGGACGRMRVQHTPTRLDLTEEHRTYVIGGRVVASCPYRVGAATWEPDMTAASSAQTHAARAFAEHVAAEADTPEAMVLDVGLDRQRGWVVIEANAPWAANPYGCALVPVVDSVVASTCARPAGRWTWEPDPHEVEWAARRPLRERTR